MDNLIDSNPQIDQFVDHCLAKLDPSDFLLIMYLFCAACDSPDGLVDQTIEEIAEGTGLSWRTVQDHLQDLHKRSVIDILSQDKEPTLVRVPGCIGYLGLQEPIVRRAGD